MDKPSRHDRQAARDFITQVLEDNEQLHWTPCTPETPDAPPMVMATTTHITGGFLSALERLVMHYKPLLRDSDKPTIRIDILGASPAITVTMQAALQQELAAQILAREARRQH